MLHSRERRCQFRKGGRNMSRFVWIVWAALLIGSSLSGCSSPGSNLALLPVAPKTTPYQLGPGDTLAIKVLGADELAGNYIVQDDGTIRILMIGKVTAAGVTSEELESRIAQKLKTG